MENNSANFPMEIPAEQLLRFDAHELSIVIKLLLMHTITMFGWTTLLNSPENSWNMGVSENSVPLKVCLIIIPFLNGYFIGNIPHFQTNPYVEIGSFRDDFPHPIPITPAYSSDVTTWPSTGACGWCAPPPTAAAAWMKAYRRDGVSFNRLG